MSKKEKIFKNDIVRKKNQIPKLITDHLEPPKFWRLVTLKQKKAFYFNAGILLLGYTALFIPVGYYFLKNQENKKQTGLGKYFENLSKKSTLQEEFPSLNIDNLPESKSFSQKIKEYEEERLKSLKLEKLKRLDKLIETNKN